MNNYYIFAGRARGSGKTMIQQAIIAAKQRKKCFICEELCPESKTKLSIIDDKWINVWNYYYFCDDCFSASGLKQKKIPNLNCDICKRKQAYTKCELIVDNYSKFRWCQQCWAKEGIIINDYR